VERWKREIIRKKENRKLGKNEKKSATVVVVLFTDDVSKSEYIELGSSSTHDVTKSDNIIW